MKGFQFFAEMPEARLSKSGTKRFAPFTRRELMSFSLSGYYNNCIAVPLDKGRPLYQGSTMNFDAVGANNDCSNGGVALISANRDYLRKRAVRISEELARRLHPILFRYLEVA